MKRRINQWVYFTKKDIPDQIFFLRIVAKTLEHLITETGGKMKLEDITKGKKVQEFYREFEVTLRRTEVPARA